MQGHGGNLGCMLSSIANGKPAGHHVCITDGFNLEMTQRNALSFPRGKPWINELMGLHKTTIFPAPLLRPHAPKLDSHGSPLHLSPAFLLVCSCPGSYRNHFSFTQALPASLDLITWCHISLVQGQNQLDKQPFTSHINPQGSSGSLKQSSLLANPKCPHTTQGLRNTYIPFKMHSLIHTFGSLICAPLHQS